ncbi:MAG: HAMP domain-containing histidine kinase [Bacteroidia bacterium]|nr:HAMP domain-containing histidine kinase [Bacteroidia bacterium]
MNDIYFDHSGFLWFSTEDGIIRYDGKKTRIFNSLNTPIIKSDRFRWILPNHQGYAHAISADGKFFDIKNHELISNEMENQKFISFSGILPQISTLNKLIDISTSVLHRKYENIFPYQLLAISSNELLAMSSEQILLFKNANFEDSIPKPFQGKGKLFNIQSNFYIGTPKGEIYWVNKRKRKLEKCIVNYSKREIKLDKLSYFSKGELNHTYVHNAESLFELKNKNSPLNLELTFLVDLPVKHNYVNVVSGNVNAFAIGTVNNGIYIYQKSKFKNLNRFIHVDDPYYAITRMGDTIISTNQDGFYNGNQFNYPFCPQEIETSVLYYNSNFIWYGSNGKLFQHNTINKKNTLCYNDSKEITCISGFGDSVLVSTSNELLLFYKNKLIINKALPNQINAVIKTIKFSEKGEIFLGNCSGLFKVINFNHRSLSLSKIIGNYCIRDIEFYENLTFLCTYGDGIIVEKSGKFIQLPLDPSTYLNKSHSIQIDNRKHIWISTNNGIFETTIPLIQAYINDTSLGLNYNRFGTSLGIKNAEFNGGCFPSSLQDKNGNIYFPSIQGLVTFNPNDFNEIYTKSPILIDQIYFNRSPVEVVNDSVIKVDNNVESLKIKLVTSQWINKADIIYQLIGYNKTPIRMVNIEDIISFTNLPSGEYILQIKNVAGLNPLSYPTKQIRIIVSEQFYETIWFQLIIVFLLAILIYIMLKIQSKRLLKRNANLEALVYKRTEELTQTNHVLSKANSELKQSAGVKNKLISILSHDIITPIKFMAIAAKNVKTDGDKQELFQTLNDIQHTADRLFDNAQNILNWIKYQNKLIKVKKTNVALYPLAEDLVELLKEAGEINKNVIRNNIDPDEIIKTDEILLKILIHNILSNAVKYVKNGHINIDMEQTETSNNIIISDNGSGLSQSKLNKIKSILHRNESFLIDNASEGGGLGYIIISELSKMIDAVVEVKMAEPNGLIVILSLPKN